VATRRARSWNVRELWGASFRGALSNAMDARYPGNFGFEDIWAHLTGADNQVPAVPVRIWNWS
jgi:hypothetical protein